MRTLKTREAATLLNVSPNTLRTWERKFGYPKARRSPGRHRLYVFAEVEALRDALTQGLSVSSAISVACEGLPGDAVALAGALIGFRPERADRAMEASLALRSMDRSVDEVLLPALHDVHARMGPTSTAWAVASRWANDWLARAQRLMPQADAGHGVLIGDAAGGELDPSSAYIRALELLCALGGCRVLSLPVRCLACLPDALAAARPDGVVLAGGDAADDDVARWAYRVRSVSGALPVALYRRGDAPAGGCPPAWMLADSPSAAHAQLLQLIVTDGRARSSPGEDRPGDRTFTGLGRDLPGREARGDGVAGTASA